MAVRDARYAVKSNARGCARVPEAVFAAVIRRFLKEHRLPRKRRLGIALFYLVRISPAGWIWAISEPFFNSFFLLLPSREGLS
jgi:hypothetical protein